MKNEKCKSCVLSYRCNAITDIECQNNIRKDEKDKILFLIEKIRNRAYISLSYKEGEFDKVGYYIDKILEEIKNDKY